ncbi:hypothetical protein EGJ86_04770 [Pseudomonas sp. o96-267]|uniref:hypothetical protein n=1 Tax=Pseudomonas sp. o96-267 TaxID=2479853 RepID=UPI000F778A43|nr:hypothetical protein [Pseudomonas sp. o96-267]RRV42030.1 hypothetical protein EGJ86_04770 [Pseudomonas sp. o96-267]
MKGWILGLSLQLLAAPLLAEEVMTVIGPVQQIEVIEIGQGPNTAVDSCKDYSVSAEEVADFLRHAIVITNRQEHDWYLYGPCYATGTLTSRYGQWYWLLRNMGTGWLTPVTGETLVLGDPRQESSLEGD